MEIKGKVTNILELEQGVSASTQKEWSKQGIVIQTDGQYPKDVHFTVWNNKPDVSNLSIGEDITASINIESREYNDRWYTEVKAWRIERATVANNAPVEQAPSIEAPDDDLPF